MTRVLSALLLIAPLAAQAVEIRHVDHRPAALDGEGDQELEIEFQLTAPAQVHVDIFDSRSLRIRRIAPEGVLDPGMRQVEWDGRTMEGTPVPPAAYHYTITATPATGPAVTWDPTDLTGGDRLAVAPPAWDPESGLVRYRLPRPARLSLRVGIGRGGPLMRTLVSWAARPAGPQAEPWDGFDVSRAVDLSRHPSLEFALLAFALPENVVVVGPAGVSETLLPVQSAYVPRESRRTVPAQRFNPHNREPGELADVHLRLSVAGREEPGQPSLVRGSTRFFVDVPEADRARLLEERFEVGFFVDGLPVYENEVGFLPMTWEWDPGDLSPGRHYVTANLWGFEGTMGTATVVVEFQQP